MAKIYENDESIVIAGSATDLSDLPAALERTIDEAMAMIDHTVHVMLAGDVLDWLLGSEQHTQAFLNEHVLTEDRKSAAKTIGFKEDDIDGMTVIENLNAMRDEFSAYVARNSSHMALAFAAVMHGLHEGDENA